MESKVNVPEGHWRDSCTDLQTLVNHFQDGNSPVSERELTALVALLETLRADLEREREETKPRLNKLESSLRILDAHVLAIENSRIFRLLRWLGTPLLDWKARTGQLLLHSPLHPLSLKLLRPFSAGSEYQLWLEQEYATSPPFECCQKQAEEFHRTPLLSIVLPVHNPRREWLAAAVDSVFAQTYRWWELCVCDDASHEGWVADYFTEKTRVEPRVRFVRSRNSLGISGALNRGGELARGEYIGFLDHDDILSPYALHHVAELLQECDADLIYSDEDRLDSGGRRIEPIFKPDWSPDLLTTCMYIGHLLVVSKKALDRVGWFRNEFDGSQDHDLVLRLADGPIPARHIPRVLYHWRKHSGSTSANPAAKPHAHLAARRALEDAVRRRGWRATVEDGLAPNTYRIRRQVIGQPRINLVICSRKAKLLKSCLRMIDKTTAYSNREIVVVQHKTGDDATMDKLLAAFHCVHVCYEGPFNFSRMNNRGAEAATGELLVFLNDDVRPLAPDWLTALVAQVQRPEVGVVGAKLVYPSGTVQHAGITIGIMDGCGHLHRRAFGGGCWNWVDLTRNVSAVTGACLAVRKRVFEDLHGFDTSFPLNYNDADLCLRARQAGYDIIYEPAALLRHYECKTRSPGIWYAERELWQERWAGTLEKGDPFYSPNLSRAREDASLGLGG